MRELRFLVFLLSSLFLVPAVSLAAGNAPASPKDDAVHCVESHYRELADLTAEVTQKNNLTTIGRTQTFEGTLVIKKPGRLRLDYTNGQTIVLDNKTVWFYSKKSKQAIKRTFADIEEANVPVAFLLGASEIGSEFDALPADGGAIDLLPKKPGAAMQKVRLRTDEAGRILQLTIFDRSGNSTEISFSKIRENTSVDDKLFRFRVPKGTEIIEQ